MGVRLPRRALLRLAAALSLSTLVEVAGKPATDFRLKEPFGISWTNERVGFPATRDIEASDSAGAALVDDLGRATPYELVRTPTGPRLEFLADLPAGLARTYAFKVGRAIASSDLSVEERLAEVVVQNSRAGVRLRRSWQEGEGPVAAVRLADGSWLPVSHAVYGGGPVARAHIEVVRRGPVLASAAATTTFTSGVTWRVTFELQAFDPAVVVSEEWSGSKHPVHELGFDLGGERIGLYYRVGKGAAEGRVATAEIGDAEKAFELEPWLRWWEAERRGTWVAVTSPYPAARFPDAMVLSAIRAPEWLSDEEATAGVRLQPIRLALGAGRLLASFPGIGARRVWLMAVVPRAEAIDQSMVGKLERPPAQSLRIKHSDLRLDVVKDWTLDWTPSESVRPRLMLSDSEMAMIRSERPANGDAHRIARLPLNEFNLGEILQYQMRTGDPVLAHRISSAALPALKAALARFTQQSEMFSLGWAPHHQRDIPYGMHLADFALADPAVLPEEKREIRATAASLAYMVWRDDYWCQAKGFAANPNMSSAVAAYRGMLACLLHDHPLSRTWLDMAVAELFDKELLTWSDPQGGWLESPHYAIVSQDAIMAVLMCARNAGRPELIAHPRLRQVAEWLAKITTPSDQDEGNRRFILPIGDTYLHEPSGYFGMMASLMRELDPPFSARMQWMHLASGSPIQPVVGGFAPFLAPYQVLLKSQSLPAAMPAYVSELFSKTGAMLRAHFGTERETQLYIISGPNHEHYSHDSGSFTFWGKGRLLANTWGYGNPLSSDDFSMVDSRQNDGFMTTTGFSTGAVLDHFTGRSRAWTRRITLVKDRDPLGLNYVLIEDDLPGAKNATWRLWLTGERLERSSKGVTLVGCDEVDLDVFCLDATPALSFQSRTLRSASSVRGPVSTTQTAIVVPMSVASPRIRVLLYPRLKREQPPEVSVMADGRRIDIKTVHGTDTLFANAVPFEYGDGEIAFRGTLGLWRRIGREHILALGAGERLSAGEHEVAVEGALATW